MSTYVGLQNSFEQLMWCPLFSGGSRQGVWGAKKAVRQKGFRLLKYQSLYATIVGCHTNVATLCRPKSGYFSWSNYAIFQGITKV